ncbi:MAG: deoxyribose-phosphate aldolase [Bacteroidales bacterium]|jgi:deoxyribose-phosphate aldolase|nr:deoxyribose-phosphate aldolase [Bacteroidales bacterium]MDD2264533.1 deoxyribose-phosphate aldolase [Bacteroidales bacterium]MDD2831768.1 deoxyribose-phosphate aldolase [Bacteroidales bacterium]MDD3209412.1 deoxyribose-phosphate aldolase [Bacteroidales bacterium]MDD3697782.1 deoxyribose-phosphate aldolase [Bacteroidales bacterium]
MDKLKQCFSFIDLTTLNATDTEARGRLFAENVNRFAREYPQMPHVAAICVYPALISAVKETLQVPGVSIAAVGGGFPASQTFSRIKEQECALCVEYGADEVDIVLSLNYFFAGQYDRVASEIRQIRQAIGAGVHLKVILETGALRTEENIRKASFLAMENGADFIKTSTGKLEPAATPFAATIMCRCIAEYYEQTHRRVGFKPAGGIVNSAEALEYYDIVDQTLGKDWLQPSFFRIGASRLANNLLKDILLQDLAFF